MKKKLNCVLLIDDDEPTNFLNSIIIKQANCTEQVHIAESGREALDYLTSSGAFKKNGVDYPRPDLIFLDLNMPAMNGWEFLDIYKELKEEQKGKIVMVMLTTSLNPDDEVRARGTGAIAGFKHKPLTAEEVEKILKSYFVDYF